jgi:small GTP-binding protein
MVEKDKVESFKIITLGNSGVGKTSIIMKFLNKDISKFGNLPTVGIECQQAEMVIHNTKIRLQVFDTAGQEKFRVIARTYYQKADGVMFVYDVTDSTSFEQICYWITEVDRYKNDLVKILVANKVDLPDPQVEDERG